MKAAIGMTVAAAIFATLTTGCTPACEGLKASAQDQQAAQNGYEVEREGNNGSTCELQQDGTWKVDD